MMRVLHVFYVYLIGGIAINGNQLFLSVSSVFSVANKV
jgi:hypothetical protein